MVLLLPVALFFLGIPREGYNSGQDISKTAGDLTLAGVAEKGEEIHPFSFPQLEQAAAYPANRSEYEGTLVRVTGKYVGSDPKRFTLVRYRMTCCAADAVPLNAIIAIDPKWDKSLDYNRYRDRWVEVVGRLTFKAVPGAYGTEYKPAIILPRPAKADGDRDALDDMLKVLGAPPANPWAS